ncbi:transcription initiation factor TFIID subunit 3 [Euwallacea similis]|uniref:transcription initiation factor TFIID subunit 3 n=1 Tax=Euwallacea similis TaxID=1736056 RepID=UPI00345042A6
MSAEYTRDHCKIAVAKILQTIGWHSINSTPLEVLTDILSSYITQIAKISNDYANEFGQTDPNLDHLGLAFQEMEVNLSELEEYVTFVNFVPPANPLPKYPLSKESNLNFLKPGSKEVVTRPIHINEHLPPMYPLLEEQSDQPELSAVKEKSEPELDVHQFKKPADVSPEFKRLKREDEGGRPTREISSVMMTTSGFLSPAREGKLPEAKAPIPPPEPSKPPSPTPPLPELVPVTKKKPEKKKKEMTKEVLKSLPDEKPPKKINNMKDILKMKRANAVAANAAAAAAANLVPNVLHPGLMRLPMSPHQQFIPPFPGDVKLPPLIAQRHRPPIVRPSSFNKALAAAKAKTEKLNTTITPIPMKSEPKTPKFHAVDKLVTEPDRNKINILKNVCKVSKEKGNKNIASNQLMQQTHDLVSKINLSRDITIEPINPQRHSPIKREPYFEDGSPPGTPPTPRTPEILPQSPPFVVKEKRKRKEKLDKPRVKKPRKQQLPHPHFMDPDILDVNMGRPKTPEAHLLFRKNPFPALPTNSPLPFPFPLANFGGPGLIPSLPFPFVPTIPDLAAFQHIPSKPEPSPPKISPKPKEVVKSEPQETVPLIPPIAASPKIPSPGKSDEIVKTEPESVSDPHLEGVLKKSKEHKKEKKDKAKKKNKKEKVKDKSEKKKLKEAKKEKIKIKKEKKKKVPKSEEVHQVPDIPTIPKIVLKVNSPSPRPETPDSAKKLSIKSVVKRDEVSPERKQREPSPGLAQISALVIGPPKPKNTAPDKPTQPSEEPSTSSAAIRPPGRPRVHPVKPKPSPKPKKQEQPFVKVDAEGNEVWICPACGQQDDGRPMIGCDGCDAWYHWVCVGIQVPPDDNENWYCKPCLAKKNENFQDKKKKRKKKDKVH